MAALLPGEVSLVPITTAGDIDRARGDKSRWVGALEAALLAGEIDLAVHSAKDVPGELAPGTAIVATPPRGDPFDVLVGDAARGRAGGDERACAGARSCSPRGPDLEMVELRGNVDTRLAKRAAGEVDVLVLAGVGLDRLGRRDEATATLTGGVFVPAPGQGVVAVQGRAGSEAAALAASADDARTHAALDAGAPRRPRARRELPHTRSACSPRTASCARSSGLPDGSSWLVEEAATGDELAARLLAARRRRAVARRRRTRRRA